MLNTTNITVSRTSADSTNRDLADAKTVEAGLNMIKRRWPVIHERDRWEVKSILEMLASATEVKSLATQLHCAAKMTGKMYYTSELQEAMTLAALAAHALIEANQQSDIRLDF